MCEARLLFEHRKARGDRTNANVPAGTLDPAVVSGNSIACYAVCMAVSFDHLNSVVPTVNHIRPYCGAVRPGSGGRRNSRPCACRKSNPDIFVTQSAENWTAKNTPCPLNGPRYGRILIQGQVRARVIIVVHIRQQHVTKMPLAKHSHMVKALPSDRTDKSFRISVLPRGARQRR